MARPRNADAAQTRARILAAAVELLRADPSSLSTREVARRAQVSSGIVHHYFGSQDELVDACIETMYQEADALVAEHRARLADGRARPADVVEQLIRAAWRFALVHAPLVKVLLGRIARTGELDEHRQATTEGPTLAIAAAFMAQRLGLPELEVKLRLKTVTITLGRWAISSDEELERLVGLPAPKARDVLEDHLVNLARMLLPL